MILSNNPLLQKDIIGQGKQSTQKLPDKGHFYGFKPKQTMDTVKLCLQHQSSEPSPNDKNIPKDYQYINRMKISQKPYEIKPIKVKKGKKYYNIKLP